MRFALRIADVVTVGFVSIASVAGVISTATAQPENTDEARLDFENGAAAVTARDYESALQHFEQAFRKAPHDVVRFNIAVCLERLGRYREAAREYELAAASTVLTETQRREARDLAVRMRAELGVVLVEGAATGTPIAVNGEQRCLLPCRLELDPGTHELTLRSTPIGETRTITVVRGETASVVFASRPRTVHRSEPPQAVFASTDGVEPAVSLDAEPSHPSRGPGWLTWVGGTAAVAGVAGIVGFGLHAHSLHDDYEAMPSQGLRDEGLTVRALANASIVVAVVGAILSAIDLIFFAPQPQDR